MPFLSPTVPVLQVLRVLDHLLAFGELHVRFLPIAPVAFVLAAAAHLTDKIRRADARDLYLENLLHRFLNLRLRRAGRNFKHHGVLRLFHPEAFFRDDRPPNDLIVRGRHRLSLPLFLCRLRGFLRYRRFLCCRLRRRFLLRGLRRGSNRFHVRHHHRLLLRIERVAQPRHCFLREHQQVMLEHIVRLQTIWRRQRYTLDVAAGAFQIAVLAVGHQQRGLLVIQLVQHGQQRLGLVGFERPSVHDRQLLLRQFCRERRAQRAQQHLLRQRIAVIARLWPVDRAAMAPERRTNRAHARAASALLLPELAARAADFALVLGLVRTAAQPAEVPPRSFMQQVLVDLRAKDRVRQLHLTDLLAIQIDYVDDRHNLFSFSVQNLLTDLLRLAYLANENVRSARSRHRSPHQQQVFVGVHLHYLQILRRYPRVAHVTRKMLVLPDTRRKRAAADAARRAVMHRAVRRIAATVVPALHAALKTLALADAAHIDEFAGLEILHQHAVADFRLVLRFLDAHFLQHLHGRDIGFLEVPGHGLVDALRLDEFHEAELRGFVSIRLFRAALHHHARPRLKHGAPDERAVVDEHLRHAQLDSDNSIDCHYPCLSFAVLSFTMLGFKSSVLSVPFSRSLFSAD